MEKTQNGHVGTDSALASTDKITSTFRYADSGEICSTVTINMLPGFTLCWSLDDPEAECAHVQEGRTQKSQRRAHGEWGALHRDSRLLQ